MADTVTKPREFPSKDGMGVVGWMVAIPIVFILLPLLPIVLLVKLIDMVAGKDQPR